MASSGNFCTLNRLNNFVGGGGSGSNKVIISNGNLSTEDQGSYYSNFVGTHAVSGTNKFYYELRVVNEVQQGQRFGWIDLNQQQNSTTSGSNGYPGGTEATWSTNNNSTITRFFNNNSQPSDSTALSGTIANGDIYCCGLDLETGKWYVSRGAALDPSSAATGAQSGTTTVNPFSNLDGGLYAPSGGEQAGSDSFYNFGQDSTFGGAITAGGNADANGFGDFAFAVPSGYLAICSGNLGVSSDIDPAQTDDDYPSKLFQTILYTGTGSAQSITGLGFKPDFVWLKCRSIGQSARIIDSNRGVSKTLTPADDQTEQTESNGIASFDTDGFSIGSATGGFNTGSATYVAWCWRVNGGTTASNSEGSITSTVQANTKLGFSIVTYAGNSTDGANYGHGLSAKPDFSITKVLNKSGESWIAYHSSMGYNKFGRLNTNGLFETNNTTRFSQEPTASLVYLGTDSSTNTGYNYVSYIWHNVKGMQHFGSYTANASDDGPFIYTGFRPRMLFVKNVDENSTEWEVRDTAVNTFNPANKGIYWDQDQAEATRSENYDILSNGFKIRTNGGPGNYNSGSTIIFGAWADVPYKYNNTF
tara:strand:- start:22 stop:1785 length:1764 start_codon:yes stop_codon:yes gene_type:complete